MRACRQKWHLVFPTLYIIIVYRVNLNRLLQIMTTTINCRVSFIDLYLVFPRNFRMVFLPHTNTVILLEPYCGTITEPGLPVLKIGWRGVLELVGLFRVRTRTFEAKNCQAVSADTVFCFLNIFVENERTNAE